MGHSWPLTKWVQGSLNLRVRWPGREARLSAPSSAEVKNAYTCTLTFVAWYFFKHGNFFIRRSVLFVLLQQCNLLLRCLLSYSKKKREAMYVKRNIEASSRNHCCCRKAKCVTYLSVCVCVARARGWVRACVWFWGHGRERVLARV